MAIKTWNWNNFRGWLSDNNSLGVEGSFQNGSYWVDVETEPNGVKLLSGTTSFTTTGRPTFQFTFWTRHYVFCDDKSIYVNGTLEVAYNDSAATTMGVIYGAQAMTVSWTTYIMLFSADAVHRADQDMGWFLFNVAATASNLVQKPNVRYWNDIYFVNKNLFCKIDSAYTVTVLFTADISNTFTWLTFFQDQFRAYSTYNSDSSSISLSGKMFLFSTSLLTQPQYIVDWDNLPIIWATNSRGSDYVIAWYSQSSSDLYVVSGTQAQPVKTNMEWNTNLRWFSSYLRAIASRFDDVYIGWLYGASNTWVFKYWKQYTWANNILTQLVNISGTIYSIVCTNAFSYFGIVDGSTYKVYKFEHQTPPSLYYASIGEIISNVTDLGNPYQYKSLLQFDIAYDCDNSYTAVPHGGTITLYARKDSSDSWTTITTNTPASWIGSIRITANEIRALWFGDFYQLELKLKLEPKLLTGNNYYTPLVKGVKLTFEDNVK
jgi:hypothetical protein